MSQLPQSSAEAADLKAVLKEIEKSTGFLVLSITCMIDRSKSHLPNHTQQCRVRLVLAWNFPGFTARVYPDLHEGISLITVILI